MDEIIEYIKRKYEPLSIITYGSYADGSNTINSDFDALVISVNHKKHHDISIVAKVQLDVFVYPASFFLHEFCYNDFIQIADGNIILDTDGTGTLIKRQVAEHLEQVPIKTKEEQRSAIEWCNKMLLRAERNDAEGFYRWHWLLTDSLEIFCDISKKRYLGPKKSLQWMRTSYPEAYEVYTQALTHFNKQSLNRWVQLLNETQSKGY